MWGLVGFRRGGLGFSRVQEGRMWEFSLGHGFCYNELTSLDCARLGSYAPACNSKT